MPSRNAVRSATPAFASSAALRGRSQESSKANSNKPLFEPFVSATLRFSCQRAIGLSPGEPEGHRAPPSDGKSYLPLFCFEGNTQDCWESSYHPGDTHVSTITIPLLERAFAKLPEPIREVRVRADRAFFDHKIIELIEERGAFYAIMARLNHALKNRLSGLRYRRVSMGVWAAESRYCPQGWPGARSFVVIRRPVPEEPSAQLHLFQMGGYSYQVLVTNLPLIPLNLWRSYNQRARAELIIRELKDAYALGKIPTKDFQAYEAFFQIVLLAYNLLNWFKPLCVPVHLQRTTLQKLRKRLCLVPSQLVRPGGVPTLCIAPSYRYVANFLET